jgi:hypothetical protein
MLNKNKQSKIIRQSKKNRFVSFFPVFRFGSVLALRSLLMNYGSKDPDPTLLSESISSQNKFFTLNFRCIYISLFNKNLYFSFISTATGEKSRSLIHTNNNRSGSAKQANEKVYLIFDIIFVKVFITKLNHFLPSQSREPQEIFLHYVMLKKYLTVTLTNHC